MPVMYFIIWLAKQALLISRLNRHRLDATSFWIM